MSDQKHLTLEGRIIIEKGLDSRLSFKAIACAVNKDCTTISKEVRGHLSFEKTGSYGRAFNDCLHRKGCPRTRVCTVCIKDQKRPARCCFCGRCTTRCPDYEKEVCSRPQKPPYVCNGCADRSKCTLEKVFYRACYAEKEYRTILSEARTGPDVTEEELAAMNGVISPLLRNGQSIYHILLNHRDEIPRCEKTIYSSLLLNTGLHQNGDFADKSTNQGFMPLWDACEDFLNSSENKARKISELIKILSAQPYKIKQGFLEFWIPTYLFIKRQDFALYDASKGAFMPNVNMEFFDLLQKHPGDFEIKKFAVDGVKLGFFNQYRRFINLGDEFTITNASFIETIKPFLSFYVRLDEYTKHTRKFDHESTMKFRDVLAKAKDPEKAFFEDLPEALGFTQEKLKQEEFINQYGRIIQRAIRELRSCYSQLIGRIVERLVDEFGLQSDDYSEYIIEIRERLAHVKAYLLTDKQREFYHHVMTEYDNRTQWYQSICYTILEQRLDALRDEQEDKLADDLIYLFRECEKYSDISKKTSDTDKNEAYSFDLVTNKGTNVRTQTYVLPDKDKSKADELEKKISKLLSGDNNVDVCTLLSILNKKMNK